MYRAVTSIIPRGHRAHRPAIVPGDSAGTAFGAVFDTSGARGGGQLPFQVIEPFHGHRDARVANPAEGVEGGYRLGEADAETGIGVGGEGEAPIGKGQSSGPGGLGDRVRGLASKLSGR